MKRQDYLNGKISHEDYYSEIAKRAGVAFTKDDSIVKEAMKSTDEHLNDIELYRWDAIAHGSQNAIDKAMRELGDFWSLSGGVCVVKQAVRNAINK